MKVLFWKILLLIVFAVQFESCVNTKEGLLCSFCSRESLLINNNQKFYYSIPNHVDLLLRKTGYDSIAIWSPEAKFEPFLVKNNYIMTPSSKGRISIYYELFKKGSCYYHDSLTCLVSDLPTPKINVIIWPVSIREDTLYPCELQAEIINLKIELHCKVISFCVIGFLEGEKQIECSDSDKFTQKQLMIIDAMKFDDFIIFNQIVVEMPDGSNRTIEPVVYKAQK